MTHQQTITESLSTTCHARAAYISLWHIPYKLLNCSRTQPYRENAVINTVCQYSFFVCKYYVFYMCMHVCVLCNTCVCLNALLLDLKHMTTIFRFFSSFFKEALIQCEVAVYKIRCLHSISEN